MAEILETNEISQDEEPVETEDSQDLDEAEEKKLMRFPSSRKSPTNNSTKSLIPLSPCSRTSSNISTWAR